MEEVGLAHEPVPRKRKIHPVWTMCVQWYETKAPSVVRKFGGIVLKAPNEALILLLAIGLANLTYLTHTILVLPNIWKNWPGTYLLASLLCTTWIMYGIYAHLYWICRDAPILPAIISMPLELLQPEPTFESEGIGAGGERILRKRANATGDSNSNNTLDNKICMTCKACVPKDAWHCNNCKKCVPDKDSHLCDVKNQTIYGPRNHVNFLGLLLYLGIGGMSGFVAGSIHTYMNEGSNWWIVLLKCMLYWNAILNFPGFFTVIALLGGIAMFCFLYDYSKLIQKTQIKLVQAEPNSISTKPSVYRAMSDFLGPKAFRRMVFPGLDRRQVKERSE